MAIRLKCGECGKEFKVKDEYSGRKTRCADCGTIIRVPGEKISTSEPDIAPPPIPIPLPKPISGPSIPKAPVPPPLPPERPPPRAVTIEQPRDEFAFDEDEEPVVFSSRDRRSSAKGNWRAVASGLNLVAIGGCIIAVSILVLLLLPVFLDDPLESPIALINWTIGIVLLTLVGFIVGLIGRIGSRDAPDPGVRSTGGISAILSMIATGLWGIVVLLLVIVRVKISGDGGGGGGETLLKLLGYLVPLSIVLAFVGEAFHALLVMKIHRLYFRDGLSVFAMILFIGFLVFGVVFGVLVLIAIVQAEKGEMPGGFGSSETVEIIQQILWLASTIAYVVLLFITRGVVSSGNPPERRPRAFDEDDAPPPRRRERERDDRDRDPDRRRPSRRPRDDYED